jgi:hypothetical protein
MLPSHLRFLEWVENNSESELCVQCTRVLPAPFTNTHLITNDDTIIGTQLIKAYSQVVDKLRQFREQHMQNVVRFITVNTVGCAHTRTLVAVQPTHIDVFSHPCQVHTPTPMPRNDTEACASHRRDSLDEVGTGGTQLMQFLKSTRDATRPANTDQF